MIYQVEEKEKWTIIKVRGNVDFESAENFRALLAQHIQRTKPVFLDLSSCNFFCSMAIGMVIGFAIQARQRGIDLKIINPSEKVRELFEEVRGSDLILSESSDRCSE